jgi:metal-responsive CopG/Arc/MetJ family transcriptional regulator
MISKDNIYKYKDLFNFMANKLYGIRLSQELLVDAEKITKMEGFSSVQEFVRQAVRDSIKKHKLQQQLMALDKLAGSQPNAKRASKKELEEHVKKVFGYYD